MLHNYLLIILVTLITVFISQPTNAQSPPNLSTNIPWQDSGGVGNNANYENVSDIMVAFNHARRGEENQLGLAANTISDLVLPSDTIWSGLSDDAKGLYLLNDERRSRAGMLPYVLGLPYAGIEQSIDGLSEYYAQYLHDNDATGHDADGSGGPFVRIDNHPEIGTNKNCHEFLPRAENLAYFATTGSSIPLPIERAIYAWIYDDGGGSNWGHREAILLQDTALNAQSGFKNNNGSNSQTGFLGFHHITSHLYKPFANFSSNTGSVVVMDFFDPVSDSNAILRNCNYVETLVEDDIFKGLNHVLTRADMAKAILQAKNITPPAVPTGVEYDDVIATHPNVTWIEQFKTEGLTEGCSSNKFCPEMTVSKAAMAKIILKAKFGSAYIPAPISSLFNDVGASYFNADWINQLNDLGLTATCGPNKFCPNAPVTREWFMYLLKKL